MCRAQAFLQRKTEEGGKLFTGIVEEVGKIKRIGRHTGSLAIEGKKVLSGSRIGDSIAVNGVCLTITEIQGNIFTADVMPETLRRSNLGKLSVGSPVNLERAMAADGRFGGHIVSGHIDGTGVITEFKQEAQAVWVTVSCGKHLLRYIIEKGSIAIDGISLTVAYVDDTCFQVSIIPHTAGETTLLMNKKGAEVNLENDVIGKYVEKLMRISKAEETAPAQCVSGVDMEFLMENGFL